MSSSIHTVDAVVIGGGPGGSTLATTLAKAGKRVTLIESEVFPRFHIGESLLPASTPIFERLGVLDQMKEMFIHKPGGKWLVENGAWLGDFAACDPSSSFAHCPYSYLVERSRFDHLLLQNAEKNGVQLVQPARVTDFIEENGRMVGVISETRDGVRETHRAPMIFDCSGRKALIVRRKKLTRPTDIRRIGLFAQYKATCRDPHLKDGWFAGQMIPDGWTWLIPLEKEKISVGLVVNLKQLKEAEKNPERFFTDIIENNDLFRTGLNPGAERISEVHVTDNMGYTSTQLHGPGWVAVGDAAFFVDPCYSSGVHMAMMSGEMAAEVFLKHSVGGALVPPEAYNEYEKTLRKHEEHVSMMVRIYYNCSISVGLQKYSIERLNPENDRKFATFVGGDFSKFSDHIVSTFKFTEEYLRDGDSASPVTENQPLEVQGARIVAKELERRVEQLAGVEAGHTVACLVPYEGEQQLAVFYVPATGADADETSAEISDHLARELGVLPEHVIALDEEQIPRATSGRILRQELVDRFEAGRYAPKDMAEAL